MQWLPKKGQVQFFFEAGTMVVAKNMLAFPLWLWLYCSGKQGHLTIMLLSKMYSCLKLYGIWLRPNASAFSHSLSGRLKKAQKFLKPER